MRAVAVFPAEKSVRVIDHPEPRLERRISFTGVFTERGIRGQHGFMTGRVVAPTLPADPGAGGETVVSFAEQR